MPPMCWPASTMMTFAQLRRLDAGDNPGARAAIDHDIRLMGLGAKRSDK